MRWRLPLLLIVVVVAPATLAGCGGTPDAKQRVRSAAKATAARSPSAKLQLERSTAFGAAYPLLVAGAAFSFPTRTGYERVDLPPLTGTKVRKAYLVFLPNKVLLAPILAEGAALPDGTSWIGVDFTGPASAKTDFPRFVAQVEGLNAQLFLDEIRWGMVSASLVGNPVVNHEPLAEYSVSVDLKRVLANAQGPLAGGTRAAVEQALAAAGASRFAKISVWVDGPGFIVKLQAMSPGSGLGTVTMHLYAFSSKISSSLPAASFIAPLSAILPLAAGAGWPWIVGANPG